MSIINKSMLLALAIAAISIPALADDYSNSYSQYQQFVNDNPEPPEQVRQEYQARQEQIQEDHDNLQHIQDQIDRGEIVGTP